MPVPFSIGWLNLDGFCSYQNFPPTPEPSAATDAFANFIEVIAIKGQVHIGTCLIRTSC